MGAVFSSSVFFLHKNQKSSGVIVMGGGEGLARAVKQSRGFGLPLLLPPSKQTIKANKQFINPSPPPSQQTANKPSSMCQIYSFQYQFYQFIKIMKTVKHASLSSSLPKTTNQPSSICQIDQKIERKKKL